FALGSPGVFSLMFRPERVDASDAEYQEAGGAAFGQLRELVSAAQESGFQPQVSNLHLSAVVWASVHGLPQLRMQGALQGAGDTDLEATLDVMNDLLLSALPASATRRTKTKRRTPR